MIVDSSFIFALFVQDDVHHLEAMSTVKKLEGNTLIIPDRVLEETFTLLVYRKGISFALEVINRFKQNKEIIIYTIDNNEKEDIDILITQLMKKISYVDYLIIYLCLEKNKKVISYDQEILSFVKKHKKGL